MPNVAFVAPFFQETTLRFVAAAAAQPGVRLALVSQDPMERLPRTIGESLAAHYRIADGMDPDQIRLGVESVTRALGGLDRLLGTLEELQVPLGELRDRLGLPGLGGEAAANFRDKARMKRVLRANDLPCAAHALAETPEDARTAAAVIGYPLVAKPPAGSGARSTFRLEAPDQLDACLRAMPPGPDRPLLIEEFVQGKEYSFDSVCMGGRIVWHSICHYSPAPLEVLREPWIQWCVLLPRERERPEYVPILEAASRALPILGLDTGLSHMEWFRRPDGSVAISEVGARPPGAQFTRLISYAHDFDLYSAWARLSVYDEFDGRDRPFAAGAAYIRGQGTGRVQAVTGLEEVIRDLGPVVVEVKAPRVGQPPSGSYEGEGYVILRHPETARVEEGLTSVVERVRVLLG